MNDSKNIKTITLKIEGENISAEKFKRSVLYFYSLLDEVTCEITGKRKAIQWFVNVKKGSIVLASRGVSLGKDRNVPGQVLFAVKDGLETIKKEPKRPEYFSEKALDLFLDLGSLAEKTNGIKDVKIIVDRKTFKFTTKALNNVDTILGYAGKAYGSIEGRIHTLSERGGLKILIDDDLTHKSIRCNMPEDLLSEAMDAFRKRVYVSGRINYDNDGQPKSIKAEEIKIFPDKKTLPTFSDVCGILGG